MNNDILSDLDELSNELRKQGLSAMSVLLIKQKVEAQQREIDCNRKRYEDSNHENVKLKLEKELMHQEYVEIYEQLTEYRTSEEQRNKGCGYCNNPMFHYAEAYTYCPHFRSAQAKGGCKCY